MKLNKILMVLAATAIVGCTSDDLSELTAEQTVEDSRLVELNSDFVLAGVGVDGVATRTHWEQSGSSLVNKFLPIYAKDGVANDLLDTDVDLEAQAVGLCWLGPEGTPVGTDVYTNYQFYHFGWLNKGEDKANFECAKLTNGSLYSEIKLKAAVSKDAEAVPSTDFTLPDKSMKSGADNLNYNTGVYKTDNKAIFGGQYIVYYPFNEDFKNQGTIPAIAQTKFDKVSEKYNTPEVGNATFRYSAPVKIEGGNQAADFGLYNLSTLVRVRVFTPNTVDLSSKSIDQIVLYSAKKQLLKQANLAADKIVAGKKGTELYASTEGTQTIVANFASPVALKKQNASPNSAFFTVLPTTVEDLKVLVHNSTDGTWATVSLPNTVFEEGNAQVLDISVNASSFKTDYIAVDEKSLKTALDEARVVATPTSPKTITVIGDITLGTLVNNIAQTADANITITGDNIIVPEDVTLTLNTNLESDLRILGKSCCSGTNGGRVTVEGGKLSNVTMEETEANATTAALYDQYNPMVTYNTNAATIAAGKTFNAQAGNIEVNAPVSHKGNINIAEGVKLTVKATGDLNFMGSTVVNDGTIEVEKAGKFDMTDSDGNATAADGKRMTNNGTFIHNVDAAVGTAVQSMDQKGEYRCRVDDQIKLDDAYQKWTACSVIEMVNTGTVKYNLGAAEPNINYGSSVKCIYDNF